MNNWDAASRKVIKTLQGHGSHLFCMAKTPDGGIHATVGYDGIVNLWRTEGWVKTASLNHPGGVMDVGFSSDSIFLASGYRTWHRKKQPNVAGEVEIWNVHDRKEIMTPQNIGDRVMTVAFSLNSKDLGRRC